MNLPAAIVSFVLAASANPAESKSIRGDATNAPRELQAPVEPKSIRGLQTCSFAGTTFEPALLAACGPLAQIAPCCCGFGGLQYKPFEFGAYPVYFRDDSEYTLANTGSYYGADGIEEYVRFVTDSSDYIETYQGIDAKTVSGFKGVDEDGLCVFTSLRTTRYEMNSNLAKSADFEVASLTTLYYDPDPVSVPGIALTNIFGYIKKVNLYLTPKYVEFFLDLLETPEVREFVCKDVLEDSCSEVADPDCEDELAALPQTEKGYIDGDSQGCRALHAVFAKDNDFHCKHVTLDPMDTDPAGVMKCFESARTRIMSLFDGEDIDKFRDYCVEQGFNPAFGYRMLD